MKKLGAIAAGVATFILFGLTSIFWGQLFIVFADWLSFKGTKVVFGQEFSVNKGEASYFYIFYLLGLGLALGFLVTFILWDITDNYRRRLLIYIPFLFVIMGFTVYNYLHFDVIMRADIQALFNLLTIFLGLVCVIQFWKFKPKSTDGIVLKYLISGLLLMCSVIFPSFFSAIWFIKRLGISVNRNIGIELITAINGTITTIVTVLQYRLDKKK